MINKANQIWLENENSVNTWMCFRKEFDYSFDGEKSAIVQIAVDSKYWLYLNGELIIIEGGLKRGPSKSDTYYDELDLSDYLVEGKNLIAVLVWYFGKSGFSHNSSGLGGFRFALNTGKEIIYSDSSWQAKKHPAFVGADPEDPVPNFRLVESNVYFDASKDIEGWFKKDYDSTLWQNAYELPVDKANAAWGSLVKRIIPQWKDFGVKKYENSSDYENRIFEQDAVLELRLPYNAQFIPAMSVTAPVGKRIFIHSDSYEVGFVKEKATMAVYYTKDGYQSYELYGWINGEKAYYHIPAGTTVHSLEYRETGYDTEFVGEFECDDEFLNRLWKKCMRTLYVTMRDTIMDCPDRERVQWWGDANIDMQMALYALDEKSLLLYKKGVESLVGWCENGGHMMTVVPSGTEQFELPLQNLAGIWGFWYYYENTGDITVPQIAYEMSKNYLKLFYMEKNGLVRHRSGSWDWPDWGENGDIAIMDNAWYYMALESCKKMAILLGKNEDVEFYDQRMKSIANSFNATFWKDGFYYHFTDNGKPDDRANALAVISGLAKPEWYGDILKVFLEIENASPYMEKYVLDAMCQMGYIDAAIARIKKRYKVMVEDEYSTLWEFWDKGGSKNHAWTGGPLITMAKYIAGVRPTKIGFEEYEIKPHLGNLNYVKCCVNSPKGKIFVEKVK